MILRKLRQTANKIRDLRCLQAAIQVDTLAKRNRSIRLALHPHVSLCGQDHFTQLDGKHLPVVKSKWRLVVVCLLAGTVASSALLLNLHFGTCRCSGLNRPRKISTYYLLQKLSPFAHVLICRCQVEWPCQVVKRILDPT